MNKYIDVMKQSDILLTNNICTEDSEDLNVYRWIRNMREIINYKERTFLEPINKYFASINSKEDLVKFIDIYINDDDLLYPFLEEHCLLSTPIQLLIQVDSKLSGFIKNIRNETNLLTKQQEEEIKKLLEPINLYNKLRIVLDN